MPRNLLTRILNRFDLLSQFNFRTTISIDNVQVTIPLHGSVGLPHIWMTESWMIALLKKLYQIQTGWFIDVGANIGQTLIKAKIIDPQLPYLGLEPNIVCASYVDRLIEANGYPATQILPVGLSDRPAVLPLHMTASPTDLFATLVGKDFREEGVYVNRTYVPVTKLDVLLDFMEIDDIFVVKIDVEGGELEVLTGALKTLKQFRPFILCEVLPVHNVHSERGRLRFERQLKVEKILRDLDYVIGRLDHDDGSVNFLPHIEVHAEMKLCDYVFCPREYFSDVASVCSVRTQAECAYTAAETG